MFSATASRYTHPTVSKRELRYNIEPQDDMRWLVCKNQVKDSGRGVTVVVFVLGTRLLKFDLFEQGYAHYHILTGHPDMRSGRIALQELTLAALTNRLMFELEYNLENYLQLNHLENTRNFALDHERITAAFPELVSAIAARANF